MSSPTVAPMKRRGGTGRKKIEIRRIERPEYRRVTFSKRRNDVFNRAKELSAVCGAEVAVITFSQGGKVFGFAYQSADAILKRFLSQYDYEDNVIVERDNNITSDEIQHQMVKKQTGEKLQELLHSPLSGLRLHDLEQRKKYLEGLIDKVRARRLKLDGSWLSL